MFRKAKFRAELASLIATDQLCIHPFVVAELACGSLPNRQKTLTYLDILNSLPIVRVADVRVMIEARSLWAKEIGFTDAQLIASSLATQGTRVWTLDKRLGAAAEGVGIRANLR